MIWCPHCQKHVHTTVNEVVRVDRKRQTRKRKSRYQCRLCGAALGHDERKEPEKDDADAKE